MKTAEEMAEALARLPRGARQHARDRRASATSSSSSARSSCRCSRCPRAQTDGRATCASSASRGSTERYGDPLPEEVARAARPRARRSSRDKGFAGYFLIVAGLRAVGEGRTTSASGPGRGSAAGSIIAYALGITNLDPHRARPALRALPQPRAHRDARHRHRLRRRAPRRGHRLRPRQVRRRQGRADHHVRHDEGARGGPRRRSRARLPVRRARQDREDDPGGARTRPSTASLDGEPRVQRRLRGRAATPSASSTPRARLEGIMRGEGVHAAGVVICRDPLH